MKSEKFRDKMSGLGVSPYDIDYVIARLDKIEPSLFRTFYKCYQACRSHGFSVRDILRITCACQNENVLNYLKDNVIDIIQKFRLITASIGPIVNLFKHKHAIEYVDFIVTHIDEIQHANISLKDINNALNLNDNLESIERLIATKMLSKDKHQPKKVSFNDTLVIFSYGLDSPCQHLEQFNEEADVTLADDVPALSQDEQLQMLYTLIGPSPREERNLPEALMKDVLTEDEQLELLHTLTGQSPSEASAPIAVLKKDVFMGLEQKEETMTELNFFSFFQKVDKKPTQIAPAKPLSK